MPVGSSITPVGKEQESDVRPELSSPSAMLFISHPTADKQFALDLHRRALEQGYDERQLFLDSDLESGIPAGADWEHVIYDRLKNCRALLVVCSPRLKESKWCFAELVVAKTLGKLVFSLMVEECELDVVLAERQSVCPCREGEEAFKRLWKSLEEHGYGPRDTRPWPPRDEHGKPIDRCPYPGLMAFTERFAPVYFGREPEAAAVLETLNTMRDRGEPRLLLVHGGSGSGKSSLLRAGVLPRLDGNRDWHVLPTLRYGQTPNDDLTLLALLAQELATRFPAGAPMRPDWKGLRAKFESDGVEQAARDFFETTQDLNLALGCRDATTLLPIDQFEELLTAAARPSAERFLTFLHALLARNNGRLLVIGTLRSDYLDVYERHPQALQPPYQQTYRLPPFPWERVHDVIVQPAARVGVTFTADLLERLKHDAPTSDALPLLAFTLEKLFRQCAGDQRIDLGEYESLGGMTGAIEHAVKKIVPPQLPPETELALRLSFVRHLVQVNEKDEFVRRPARWFDLPAAARPLLQEFVNARLLHTSEEGESATAEVSHEALFRCWPALVDWLKVSARVLRWRRDVERDRKSAGEHWSGLTRAQLAVAADWPEQRPGELTEDESRLIHSARRRVHIFRSAVAATVAVIVAVAALAIYQRAIAESRRKQSDEYFKLAETQREIALTMVRDTLYAVQDELEQSPNTDKARKRIEDIIGNGIDNLRDERLRSDTLTHLKAISNISKGLLALESSVPDASGSQPFDAAHELFEEATTQLLTLSRRDVTNAQVLRDLSWVYNKHGELFRREDDIDRAFELFQKGLECIDRAADLTPGQLASDQMWSRLKLGDYFDDLADTKARLGEDATAVRAARLDAADWYEQSLRIGTSLAHKEYSKKERSKLDNASGATLDRLCDVYHDLGLKEKEMQAAEAVVELREKIRSESPSSRFARQYLAHAFVKLGAAHMHMNQPADALRYYVRSMDERRELFDEERENEEFASYLAESCRCVAEARFELGQGEEALAALDEHTEIYHTLCRAWPDDADLHGALIDGVVYAGAELLKRDRVREAGKKFQLGLDAAVAYDAGRPEPQFEADIAKLRELIAECEKQLKEQ